VRNWARNPWHSDDSPIFTLTYPPQADSQMPLPLPIISAWDPRATSSGSLDPLGALRAYTAIATTLLPGATTITTRPRYLSWVCAGLRLLDELPDPPRGGQAGRARRKRILPWERLIALATGWHAKAEKVGIDHPCWQALRGVSYVRTAVSEKKTSFDFGMLKNQAGVGGVGTYWVTLVQGGLVEDASARLTSRGEALAEAFLSTKGTPPRAKLLAALAGVKGAMSVEELTSWGAVGSLDASVAGAPERRHLLDALLESETHRRMATALGGATRAHSRDDCFKQLQERLAASRDELAGTLATVVAVTRPFEALHGALLDRFDRLRSADTNGRPVAGDIAAGLVGAPGALGDLAAALRASLDENPALPRAVSSPVRQFLVAVEPVCQAKDAASLLVELLRHHERVQSGKSDPSRQPKQPWVELRPREVLVSPRFALDALPTPRPVGGWM